MKYYAKLRQVVAACTAAAVMLSATAAFTSPGLYAAPVAQVLQAEEVTGVLTGGQFAKIWLKLTPTTRNQSMTVTTEWDRQFPESSGLGFYILDQDGLSSVLNESSTLGDANLAAGSKLAPNSPDNQLGAVIQATGGEYTIVLYNDSPTDASFTLRVQNGTIEDDANQVRDLRAAPTAAAGEDAAGEEGDATAAETPAAATPAPAASTETTATVAATATTVAAETPAAATPAAPAASTVTTATLPPGVTVDGNEVRAPELRGFLGEQNSQHYFEMIPSERDATITVLLSFEPQDNGELARRLNFWVLDQSGFTQYTGGSSVVLSEIAIAAGSSATGLLPNQRQAIFTASGTGSYVVIVYNNSRIPGDYTLSVQNATLVDDSQQSNTAQQVLSGAALGATGTTTGTATVTGTTATAAGAAAPAPASSGRTGEPGGTYVVQAGDTLSLIARDIYGDLSLWDELCAYNSLGDCNTIEVGQTLRLPTREEIGAGIAPAATPAATATPAGAAARAAATPTATVAAGEEVTATTGVTTTEEVTATEPTTATSTSGPATEDGAGVNLVAALEAAGSFDTLVQALKAAGLADALEGAGPFTIFAPTDAAFAALPAGALDQLLQNPTGQLTQILLFHVLPGRVTVADVENGMQATTQQGKAVTFEVSGGSVKVNGANVTVPDIGATNGIIHAIDAVILPPPD